MKNITKIFAIAFVALGFSATSFAQTNTATALASGTIVQAITIAKSGTDLKFGNIIPGATGGTVTVDAAGNRGSTGTITLVAGSPSAAVFTVSGTGSSTYSITLPANSTVTVVNGANTMAVDNFTSTPSGTGTLSGGTQELRVGATLTVGNLTANPAGVYQSATGFPVTVNYN